MVVMMIALVAIKKCKFKTNTNLSDKQKHRWNNEVQIMQIINHPNIIKYKPIPPELEKGLLKNNPTKLPLLPMEYCRKGNLRHLLCKPKNTSGLQEEDVRCILEDISSGLHHLHDLNITHRDIKPDNIVLQHCDNRKGNTIYKIIDLGYAKELNDTVVSFVGTLHYLAPEIFQTEHYNSSVDFWSMGVLTFEIICGVLPFLPHLPPIQRFEDIRKKGPEDICIYLSYSGRVAYSSEIKKENYISNSLKQSIEVWLRHVLQFDPRVRSLDFPNDVKVFDYLKNILKKRIITVFSVPKLEFYSYEINESTLFSTLEEWISRDIKVPKSDMIVLFNKYMTSIDPSSLVVEILKNSNNVFVFKRGILMNDAVTYNFPKLIKELIQSTLKFDMRFIKPLYAQTVYYVTTEKAIVETFKESFNLFIAYLKNLVEYLKHNATSCTKNIVKIITQIECYNNIRKNNACIVDLNTNKEYKDCLTHCQKLLTSLDKSIANFDELKKKITVIIKRHQVLNGLLPEMEEIINNCNIEEQYQKVITLIERSASNKEINPKTFTSSIKDIVLDTVKTKDTMIRSKRFKSYISAMVNVQNSVEALMSWISQYNNHIAELSKSFEQSEIAYKNIIVKATENKNKRVPEVDLSRELLNLPTTYLIQENKHLRFQFEEILSKSILSHKNYSDSIKSCSFS
ncbi:inhibitor of nuclear factor kappa-B kinase subunit alpha-like isoform X2 [Anoplophora glabripennis]|uniref:inhibitor of nuclear factor kappa-B kinase subunit alpha-like isoform X2 n=1 Tax=Anoplophora glabripennis TaxID=217634 RepID=UPI000874C8C4|nr:inhibitor of nuclear factor kappa-B kinase subunit alpha-like isoform X2 [Anoplophora glabripennis]